MKSVAVTRVTPSSNYYKRYLKTDPVADFEHAIHQSDTFCIASDMVADLVLCPDLIFHQNRHAECPFTVVSKLRRKYGRRLRFYDSSDNPLPAFCGGYVSLEKGMLIHKYNCSVPYIATHSRFEPYSDARGRKHLWSFMGSAGTPASKGYEVRKNLLTMSSDESYVYDSSNLPVWQYDDHSLRVQLDAADQMKHVMQKSRYVACPRGGGATSMRFYEAMACGAVPVLIGDSWIIPDVPYLGESILRIRQRDVTNIHSYIANDAGNWESRQQRIVQIYRTYLSSNTIADTVLGKIAECDSVLSDNELYVSACSYYLKIIRKIVNRLYDFNLKYQGVTCVNNNPM